MFEEFKKELSRHQDGGYHHLGGRLDREEVCAWFNAAQITPPELYVAFLCDIGPGSFFGGALVIYPLSGARSKSVASELSRLRTISAVPLFPIGYDGTTESCYCLEAQVDGGVYWFSWEEKKQHAIASSFQDWIEAKPVELFREQVYQGHKKLTNVSELVEVMNERSAFTVRLLNFEKQLSKKPDGLSDLLCRYNKVVLEVTKMRPVGIAVLTVLIERQGSSVGSANVEYVSLPVSDIPVNVPTTLECYVFDPFNVSFRDLAVKFNPVIDLGSKMRTRFKELSHLLKK